jgi:hypothetical protein
MVSDKLPRFTRHRDATKRKTPTTEELLERKRENAFRALEKDKPCKRDIISEQSFFWKTKLIGVSISIAGAFIVVATLVACFYFGSRDTIGWVLTGGLIGVVVGILVMVAVVSGDVHKHIAEFSLPCFMNADNAGKVAAWAEKYPRIKAICIYRGSINPSRTLTSVDFANIRLACEEIEQVDEKLAKLQKDREQARKHLNKHGLSDLIQSAAEHHLLVVATPEALQNSKPRRV